MSMDVVDVNIESETSSDNESNCQSERPTRSQSLQHSKDDNESSPAGAEGVKDEENPLTLVSDMLTLCEWKRRRNDQRADLKPKTDPGDHRRYCKNCNEHVCRRRGYQKR